MNDIGHSLKDVTVDQFIETLRDAVTNLDVVQPPTLRGPLALWLRAVEERAVRDGWTQVLGRPVVAEWNAAQTVLTAAGIRSAR